MIVTDASLVGHLVRWLVCGNFVWSRRSSFLLLLTGSLTIFANQWSLTMHATLSIYSGNPIDWVNGRTVIHSILLEGLNRMRMFLIFLFAILQEESVTKTCPMSKCPTCLHMINWQFCNINRRCIFEIDGKSVVPSTWRWTYIVTLLINIDWLPMSWWWLHAQIEWASSWISSERLNGHVLLFIISIMIKAWWNEWMEYCFLIQFKSYLDF
jgi:hypothetical protein